MSTLSEKLRELRKLNNLTQKDVASYLGISESGYGYYEQGRNEPSLETLRKLAYKYDVSVAYLTGEQVIENHGASQNLTEKDEKDIAKRMEQIRKDLTSEDGLLFNGEPMSEEAIESFLEAMEYAVRQTQRINKKYIPKKYRKDEDQ